MIYRRRPVLILWSPEKAAWVPILPSGEPLPNYHRLTYGRTPESQEGKGDDGNVSELTVDRGNRRADKQRRHQGFAEIAEHE